MKKNLIFTAVLCVALVFGFSACENPDDNEELLERIEQLENQLKDQQSGKDDDKTDSADKDGDKDTSSDNEQNGDGAPDSGDDDTDTPSVAPDGAFSVSSSKYVVFSPGNLQYTQSIDTWSFAENQWDYIGTDNVTGGEVTSDEYGYYREGTALADKIDLFGWSTSATNFGVSISDDEYGYSGSFVDWGTNQIGSDAPNTWRTLTYDEWYYLLEERTNASSLIGIAEVNGVNGLILLPDGWSCPDGVTFKYGFHDSHNVGDYYAAYQTFTAAEWSKMEVAGAVFLPAAGERYGSVVGRVRHSGLYWSATEYSSTNAGGLWIGSNGDGAFVHYGLRYDGNSVRLVKDL